MANINWLEHKDDVVGWPGEDDKREIFKKITLYENEVEITKLTNGFVAEGSTTEPTYHCRIHDHLDQEVIPNLKRINDQIINEAKAGVTVYRLKVSLVEE